MVDPKRGRITVEDYGELWLGKSHAKKRPSTRARDESYMRSHVFTHFGGWRISDLTPPAVQEWVELLSEQSQVGVASHSRRRRSTSATRYSRRFSTLLCSRGASQ